MTTPAENASKIGYSKVIFPIFIILAGIFLGLYLIRSQFSGVNTRSNSARIEIQTGNTLPPFEFERLDGNSRVKVAEFSAKILVINFWATWCDSCVSEMPSLVSLQRLYEKKGVQVIGVNLDENPESTLPKAIEKLKINFPVFKDPEGVLGDLFDVHAIPLTVVLNQDRKILYVKNGEQDWIAPEIKKQMEQWIKE